MEGEISVVKVRNVRRGHLEARGGDGGMILAHMFFLVNTPAHIFPSAVIHCHIIIHVMNNFYSPPKPYLARWITSSLQEASQDHAVIVLTGARQVGKSTLDGKEVDFVVEHGRRVMAVEVKATRDPGYRDIFGLQAFLDVHPSAAAGLLLHGGTETKRLDKKILAVPWSMLTG
jgi:hypothetical protein